MLLSVYWFLVFNAFFVDTERRVLSVSDTRQGRTGRTCRSVDTRSATPGDSLSTLPERSDQTGSQRA